MYTLLLMISPCKKLYTSLIDLFTQTFGVHVRTWQSIHNDTNLYDMIELNAYSVSLKKKRMKQYRICKIVPFFSFFFFLNIDNQTKRKCRFLLVSTRYPFFKHFTFYIFARFANTYCCTHCWQFFFYLRYNRACSHMCFIARFICHENIKNRKNVLEIYINNINSRLRVKFIRIITYMYISIYSYFSFLFSFFFSYGFFKKVIYLPSVNFLHKKYSFENRHLIRYSNKY